MYCLYVVIVGDILPEKLLETCFLHELCTKKNTAFVFTGIGCFKGKFAIMGIN